nr:PREDICTED: LOW QUALITY PROTEIN: proline-rich nuclear receptor coactivator 1 [Anolis carolinensis]|eukprot:XP_003215597.1 PREDICTED: LOW QUALITY PROTEIN: proline-rich nuclear receptor coactivator 1 [Anolis carolinensis]
MVTTTAPSPFLARLPLGAEGALQLPAAFFFQRLLRGDYSGDGGPAQVGHAGGGARPALKRVRRRRGKLRAGAAGLAQSRYQQYQQHRRSAAQETARGRHQAQPPSEPRLETTPTEEASKPLRKELFKNRLGKSENQPAHGMHLCEQSKTSRQRNKCNIPVNKVSATKKGENNFWQESVSPELIKKQEKKPLKTTENVKLKKTIFLTEASQKANYAGAKFSDPPSPSVLPKPPSHWVGSNAEYSDQNKEMMAVHLKTLLKVQA